MLEDEELTYKIRGCVFEVFRELGAGFLEKVYENALVEAFAREYGEIKNCVISPIFLKKEINSTAIERVFRENRGNSSIFNPSYLSCKGL